jgi:nifR3 family TIM-barrel protein
MAGLTNWPFRRLALEAGAGLTVTEMASAAALAHRGRSTQELLTTDPELEKPFCVQLFGKDPRLMALAAQEAVRLGADLVDLNLACPARKVVGSGHGGALLRDPALAQALVQAVAEAIPAPVTVKLRPGFRRQDGPTVLELGPSLARAGAAALTLHPRYVSDRFGGQADWTLVTELARRVEIPVVGSGDLTTPWLAVERLQSSGAAAVMIGRAARGRPWIFRQCLEILRFGRCEPATWTERLTTAVRHARLLEAGLGPRAAFRLRTVMMWYAKGLPGAAALRAAICRLESVEAQIERLTEAIEQAQAAGWPAEPDLTADRQTGLDGELDVIDED